MKLWTKLATLIRAATHGTSSTRTGAPSQEPPEAPPVPSGDREQPLQDERVADMLRQKLTASDSHAQRAKKGD